MSGAIFGGDEVGALVFDFGSNTLRAGYAGADSPTVDIHSHVGIIGGNEKSTCKYAIGNMDPGFYESGMEIHPLLQDGLVDNWEHFEETVNFMYKRLNATNPEEYPILFSEPSWNTKDKREKMVEIMFESFRVPAVHIAKNAVLSCFANSRSSGLVFDCGSIHMSAVPVYDGIVLNQGIVRSPLAGDFITQQCEIVLTNDMKVSIVPTYRIKSKATVKVGETPIYTEKQTLSKVHPSFHKLALKAVMQDFAASVLQVADDGYDSHTESFPTITYEFPDGLKLDVGHERFMIPEAIFDAKVLKDISGASMLTASNVINNSINLCDVDTRTYLYSNVVVCGGNTLIQGFIERLQRDMFARTPPSMRLKLLFANSSSERRFSSWIGGSILASLGTFQQMWISKHEYEETGRSIIGKKCL